MKHLFTKLLDLALKIASKPKAVYFLFTISFFESFFFIPLPPDFILAPMVLSKPQKAWFYASITLLGSFIGSCIGFAIGFFVIDFAIGFIETLGLQEYYAQAVTWLLHGVQAWYLLQDFHSCPTGYSPLPQVR